MLDENFSPDDQDKLQEIFSRFQRFRAGPDIGLLTAAILLKNDDYESAVERAYKLAAVFERKLSANSGRREPRA